MEEGGRISRELKKMWENLKKQTRISINQYHGITELCSTETGLMAQLVHTDQGAFLSQTYFSEFGRYPTKSFLSMDQSKCLLIIEIILTLEKSRLMGLTIL